MAKEDGSARRDAETATSVPRTKQGASSKAAAPRPQVDAGAAADDESASKARKGALFLAAVVALYIVYLVFSGQMAQFVDALATVDTHWVLLACVGYGLYFVFGVAAYVIAVYLDHDSPVGVRDLMSVEASGVFFGNLTPMQAGSVPSQIARLTRTGLDVGEASATQFTRFIMFQFGVVLFAAVMLVAKLQYFFDTFGDIIILNLVVFGVHLLELVALFVICLCPHFVMRVGNWVLGLATRHGWLKGKDVERWNETINVQVMEFSRAFRRAASDLPSMGLTLLVTMAQLFCLYMIPWFVLNAFGIRGDFLECLAAGSMVQLVSSAVPLPGGTGGAEGGFIMFYGPAFGTSTAAGFLVWRLITFIGPTILAAPLLGLRTTNRTRSIYQRVQALAHGRGGGGVSISGAQIAREAHEGPQTRSRGRSAGKKS